MLLIPFLTQNYQVTGMMNAVKKWLDIVIKLVIGFLIAFATDNWAAHYVAVAIILPILTVLLVEGCWSLVEWPVFYLLYDLGQLEQKSKLFHGVVVLAWISVKIGVLTWLFGYQCNFDPISWLIYAPERDAVFPYLFGLHEDLIKIVVYEYPRVIVRVSIFGLLRRDDVSTIQNSIEAAIELAARDQSDFRVETRRWWARAKTPTTPQYRLAIGLDNFFIFMAALMAVHSFFVCVAMASSLDKERKGVFGPPVLMCTAFFIIGQCAVVPMTAIVFPMIKDSSSDDGHRLPHDKRPGWLH